MDLTSWEVFPRLIFFCFWSYMRFFLNLFIYSCKFTWINLTVGRKKRFRKQLEINDDFPRWLAVQLISIDFIITNYNRLNHFSPHAGRGKYTPLCVFVFVPWPHSMNECTLTLKTMISVISDFIEERLDYFTPNGIIIYKMNIMSFWRILEKAILLMNSREKMLAEAINQLRNRVIFFP